MLLYITPRERQALGLLADNATHEEVAVCFGVRMSDVGSCLKELFSRMGVSNQTEAIAVASRRGLLGATAVNESAGEMTPV
jgi:DNA-binding CsgD family transcriptional regulator